ncbi:MAG: fatty acyl-AMP ligase [Cyclobacteriaceae bacterium]
MTHLPTSLVEILRWRAKNQPHRLAYRYLIDGEYEEVVLTYEELDRRARSIGGLLQSSAKAGDRALIIFPPGLDFIAAYFGCLYAKILAIPAYPPHPARPERNLPIILRIAADAKPAVALLTSSLFDVINSRKEMCNEFGNIQLLATDNPQIDDWADQWQQPEIGRNDLAFLQYTSGSTTAPRGVMISHGNLLHNMDLIGRCFGVSSENHGVIWLPPYHDMGLIGGILQPVYSGIPVTLIPHMMFLQRPFRWLQTISRFNATTSGGPNFAYDLCIRKIKKEQRELLDLSSWEVAFNGAEPVYHKTLDQFADYFAPCGFRREAFLPCYGLAESTLMVMGAPKARSPLIQNLTNSGLEQNQAIITPEKSENTRTLVSCGQNFSGQDVRIVNVETLATCQADEVGEIWVSGPSVARGYWNKPSETKFTFGAWLSNSKEGPFLRTGDLGFLHEGELYVTGRIKNLIISEGKNHYPHDIERTVEGSHPAIRQAGCAVFSIYKSGGEDIIIIVEIDHKFVVKTEEVIKEMREAVSIHHGLHVHDIILTKPGGIPKTTSGKIRHFLCKEYYLAGTFKKIN